MKNKHPLVILFILLIMIISFNILSLFDFKRNYLILVENIFIFIIFITFIYIIHKESQNTSLPNNKNIIENINENSQEYIENYPDTNMLYLRYTIHEFNNILTGIQGYLELSLNDNTDSEYITKAYSESEKAGVFCKNMTFLAKNKNYIGNPIHFQDLIHRLLSIPELNKNVYIDFEPNLNFIFSNNLVITYFENLIHFINKILISPQKYCIYMGYDSDFFNSSITIDKSNIKNNYLIFIHNHNIKNEITMDFLQSCFNLLICKKTAKLSNGTFEILEDVSTIDFSLSIPSKVVNPILSDRTKANYLIIDNQFSIREILYREILKNGEECDIAKNLEEAKDLLTINSYDTIISEFYPSDIFIKNILEQTVVNNPEIKIIITTAKSLSEQEFKKIQPYIYKIFSKPFTKETLLNIFK